MENSVKKLKKETSIKSSIFLEKSILIFIDELRNLRTNIKPKNNKSNEKLNAQTNKEKKGNEKGKEKNQNKNVTKSNYQSNIKVLVDESEKKIFSADNIQNKIIKKKTSENSGENNININIWDNYKSDINNLLNKILNMNKDEKPEYIQKLKDIIYELIDSNKEVSQIGKENEKKSIF